jgi:hypothetical protein
VFKHFNEDTSGVVKKKFTTHANFDCRCLHSVLLACVTAHTNGKKSIAEETNYVCLPKYGTIDSPKTDDSQTARRNSILPTGALLLKCWASQLNGHLLFDRVCGQNRMLSSNCSDSFRQPGAVAA